MEFLYHGVSPKPKREGECQADSHIHWCNTSMKETSGFPLPHRRLFSLLSFHFHFTSSWSKCYHFAGLLYLLLSPLVLLLFSQSFLFLTQSECLSADSTAGYMSSEASEAASMSVVQEQLGKKSVVKQIQYKMLINNYGPSFKCSLQKHKTPYFHCKLKKYCTLQAECEETDQ